MPLIPVITQLPKVPISISSVRWQVPILTQTSRGTMFPPIRQWYHTETVWHFSVSHDLKQANTSVLPTMESAKLRCQQSCSTVDVQCKYGQTFSTSTACHRLPPPPLNFSCFSPPLSSTYNCWEWSCGVLASRRGGGGGTPQNFCWGCAPDPISYQNMKFTAF